MSLFNMPAFTAETLISRCLLSDHFVLETTIPIQPAPAVSRKWLAVVAARMPRLVTDVEAWYRTAKGSFTDAASLYHGLLDAVESFVKSAGPPSGLPSTTCTLTLRTLLLPSVSGSLPRNRGPGSRTPPIRLPETPWSPWRATSLKSDRRPAHDTGSPFLPPCTRPALREV